MPAGVERLAGARHSVKILRNLSRHLTDKVRKIYMHITRNPRPLLVSFTLLKIRIAAIIIMIVLSTLLERKIHWHQCTARTYKQRCCNQNPSEMLQLRVINLKIVMFINFSEI